MESSNSSSNLEMTEMASKEAAEIDILPQLKFLTKNLKSIFHTRQKITLPSILKCLKYSKLTGLKVTLMVLSPVLASISSIQMAGL
ncbi:hypothetical protein MA16_Dca015452 [Dendrobium catenatum]|uniref:Uncharacterized protein n=1 Tax=Dendrobium catenatum TaxID=906689 RepID=A0A2I0VBX2_9ASPA|nr:hypothetical protein MA16_Dca015452 [Dendrobium catenatum]